MAYHVIIYVFYIIYIIYIYHNCLYLRMFWLFIFAEIYVIIEFMFKNTTENMIQSFSKKWMCTSKDLRDQYHLCYRNKFKAK
jgi:hypothetical protein